jgi:chaperonin GroES
MNIKPIGNRLVVKLIKQKNTSASGIILTTKEENEQTIGTITTIGTGGDINDEINITKLGLKTGDKIIFGRYAGEEIKDQSDSETIYKILKSSDILAVVEE